jgi:predicted phosphodiesterase
MRIALISDIHGNLVSLEVVLADIMRAEVDQIICLGDLATLGPQPRQVVERIAELGCACIMGNHDTFLLDQERSRAYMDVAWFAEHLAWCVDQLTPDLASFIATFQPTIEIPLCDRQTLLCFHGSPSSSTDVILAQTRPDELDSLLAPHQATVMAGGHTHVQMLRRHKDTLLINAGSVGLPFEQMPFAGAPRVLPWAEYGIVHCQHGMVGVELRQVAVDLDAVKEAALASDMPDRLDWVDNWVI